MNYGEERRIRSIVGRATPLWERELDAAYFVEPPDPMRARRRLERWSQVLGDANLLDRRLLSSNLPAATLESVMGVVERVAEGALPSWAWTLASILHFQSVPHNVNELRDLDDRSYDRARPLPFQEVLVGFVRYAREQVSTNVSSSFDVLRSSAVHALERQLLAHLTFVANLTVGRDFYEFRFERAPASAIEFAWQQQQTSTEIYSAYVQHMHERGLVELLDGHPVLARLLCQSVDQWINISVNFCERFKHDFSELRVLFGWKVERPEGVVARLRTDLSDRHHGGQTVTECILCTGEHVIYKPRTVEPEIAFYQLIEYLNNRGLFLDLKVIKALDQATHGWVESVTFTPCRTNAEVERFYARAGMLLAVLHVLGVTDIHRENLIACGEHPVVVDLETLLSGSLQALQQPSKDGAGEARLDSEPSVLSTGLLPRWQTSLDGHKFDMSALGADGMQDPDVRLLAWQSINTDQMMLSGETKFEASMTHRIRLGNKLSSIADHLPVFIEGFKQVYFFLLDNRQQLMADDRLLGRFDGLELRILVRNTATYTRLHLYLLHPEFLKDGIDRSIELEWLARPLSGTMAPSEGRKLLYEREREAMENLDIPHFGTSIWRAMDNKPDDEDLFLLGGERDSRVIRQRLASLSSSDYLRQLVIIEEAVRSRFMAH